VALLAAIIFSIPVAIVDPKVGQDEGSVAANLIAQLIQVAMLIAVPLAIAQRGKQSLGDTLRSLGVRRFAPSAFGWMALAVVVYLVVGGVLYLLIQPEQEDIAQNFGPTSVQVLLIVIAAPISEELSFRGFLFGGLRARTPALVAALISGGLFGALHAATGIAAVPQLVAFGVILALLYERTGSIVPGLLLHALNNSAALLAS
jgi:membrane protease YdiL (CAAX protease family)